MEPKFLHDWTAQSDSEDPETAMITLKWVSADGPGQTTIPLWLFQKLRGEQ